MYKRPNIIIILADDMGYSDIGCFGSEINTPNIDELCNSGQTYTQYYTIPRCCPSRAALLTGLFPHQTGIGHMMEDHGLFGYRGFLNRNCVTMAELLRDSGYHTYLAGKWHLGQNTPEQYPNSRGFERFYGIREGACDYFKPQSDRSVYLDEQLVTTGENYYTTDAFTDYAMRFIDEQKDNAPFFLYLAYTAPHWPLQAPEENIKKYRGLYMSGWDKIREQRYNRMIEKGIINAAECVISPRDPEVHAWDMLDETKKDEMDYRMAVYAAQIDRMDSNIGRLVSYLKERCCFDDTLILFQSDNGGCAEGGELGRGAPESINKAGLVTIDDLFVSYGQAWANVSNTPFRRYKHYVHEGGIATPLIAHWTNGIKACGLNREVSYLIDLMPTILEVAGVTYPETYNGNEIPQLEGKSLIPVFETGIRDGHDYMFWEHELNCAVRRGKYKAVRKEGMEWELYDMEKDRSELYDLSKRYPDILNELTKKWQEWAETHHVLPSWQ